jgi:FkbH-like protein
VRQSLPEVAVLGEDLFALRRALLTDPRLQPVRLTEEAAARSELVKAQLDRTRMRAEIPDEAAFIASLEVVSTVEQLTPATATVAVLERVRELIVRTTQFNATGRTFTVAELQQLIGTSDGAVYTLRMSDRLADHGLVGAAIVAGPEILNVVLSCRVIGLGGEHALLARIVEVAAAEPRKLIGRIVATDRNIPVRHLYAENGFTEQGAGRWTLIPAGHATPAIAKRVAVSATPPDDRPVLGIDDVIQDGASLTMARMQRLAEATTEMNERPRQ